MIAEHPLPPAGKVAKLYDANGLLLVITGSGQRGWRYKFRLAGKEKQVSLGVYPDVPIESARTAALAAKKLVAKGLNPADLRREKRAAEYIESINTFAKVGRDFLALDDTKAKRTADKHQWQFDQLAPLHTKLVTAITAPDVLKVLRGPEAQGKREAAHRCGQFASRVAGVKYIFR